MWAGAVLLFPDNRVYAFQVNRPEARIQVSQKFQRMGVWTMAEKVVPMESTIEINLKGDAYFWNPDGSAGERLVSAVLTQDWGSTRALTSGPQ